MAKAFVSLGGDPHAGIAASDITVDFELWNKIDDMGLHREETRKRLRKFFEELMDDARVGVRFEDECGDCARRLNLYGKCDNPNCPSKMSEPLDRCPRCDHISPGHYPQCMHYAGGGR